MSNLKSRTFQIALAVVAVLIVALILPLIGNIHEIEFKVGRPVDFSMSAETGGMPPDSPGWYLFTVFLRVLFVLAGIVFVYQFIANRSFRRMYIFLFVALGSILLISELLDWDQRDAGSSPEAPIEMMWDGPIEQDLNLSTENREVEPSNAIAILLAIALSSVVVVVGAFALTSGSSRDQLPRTMDTEKFWTASPMQHIAFAQERIHVLSFCSATKRCFASSVSRANSMLPS